LREIERIKSTLSTKDKDNTSVLRMSRECSKIDLSAEAFRYNILESLILAQDERWRRA
jgi:hypothetical protein